MSSGDTWPSDTPEDHDGSFFSGELNIPDDLGDLEDEFLNLVEEQKSASVGRCIAVILSPIDAPAALLAALNLVGVEADVVPTTSGSGVFMDVPQHAGDDSEEAAMAALLGDDRPLPESVDQMARLVSKLSKGGAVALTSWTSDSDAGLAGNIVASRYVGGELDQALPSGLVLANLDLVIEELLLGRITPDQVREGRGGGRWTGWMRGPGFRS